jgi:hypothetical protein
MSVRLYEKVASITYRVFLQELQRILGIFNEVALLLGVFLKKLFLF